MSSEIFEDGLPKLLIDIMRLTPLTVENKKEVNNISKMPLEKILALLEDYLNTLPTQDMNELTVKNRIKIVNIRNIFLGISVVFDAHFISLLKCCERNIKQKEAHLKLRELNASFKVRGTKKPRARKVKEVQITLNDDVNIIQAPVVLIDDFLVQQPAESGLLGEFPLDKEVQQPAESGLLGEFPLDKEEEDGWPVLEDFINPLLEDLRIRRETIERRQNQVQQTAESGLLGEFPLDKEEQQPAESGLLEELPLDKEARPLVLDEPETDRPPRPDLGVRPVRPKYKFFEIPHFSTEDYFKFLRRKSDKVFRAYYDHRLLEELISKKYKPTEKESCAYLFNFDFGIPATSIPVPSIETPLKYWFRPPTPPAAEIDAVGFHKISILGLEQPGDEAEEVDELRSARSFRPSFRPSGIPERDPHHLPIEEEYVVPIPAFRPSEPIPLVGSPEPVLQAQEPSVGVVPTQAPPIAVPGELPVLSVRERPPPSLMSETEVLGKLNEICIPENGFIVTFVEICPVSETRLTAANIFQHLINLWNKKIVHMHQTGTSPTEVFIQLNPLFSE